MDHLRTAASEHRKTDFDIHGVVRIRLIGASRRDLDAACSLLGSPSKLPLTEPDITVRFVGNLPVRGMKLLGADAGFADDGFFLLQKGTKQPNARIPFEQVGGPCEIVCRSGIDSVPFLMSIVSLTALKRECIPLHAAAVVYNGVGILMAGWAHCGKTAALMGFASMGAEYVGEEWVLLSNNGQRMQGLVRPLEISHRHVATLPNVRSAVNLTNRCAFYGIGLFEGLQKVVSAERARSNLLIRSLKKASAALVGGLRLAVPPSAIFQDRVQSRGAPVDKVFLFTSHEDDRIEVEATSSLKMARCLSFLIQNELSSLQRHYAAYRFAFPGQRNEFFENAAEYSFETLLRALHKKETYIVRLPYPHVFAKLYKTIQPFCRPTTGATSESMNAVA